MCVFCDSFLCSISLLLLSDFPSCVSNSVLYIVHRALLATATGKKKRDRKRNTLINKIYIIKIIIIIVYKKQF